MFDQIVAELANQYVLSYSSTNPKQDSGWRNIKVRVRNGKLRHQSATGISGTRTAAGGEVIMQTGSGGIRGHGGCRRRFWCRRRTGRCCRRSRAAADQTPAFRSGVEVVTVDVGVVDRQGQPLRGLTPADFVVTVGGQPRRVVTAEFVERAARPAVAARPRRRGASAPNEGGGVGRLFVFIVDQNTLDLGNARRVASAAGALLHRGSRSPIVRRCMLLPLGPNVAFTWAHDRVREALQRVIGMGRPMTRGSTAAWPKRATSRIATCSRCARVGERECGPSLGFGRFGQRRRRRAPGAAGGQARVARRAGGARRRRRRGAAGRPRAARRHAGGRRRRRRWTAAAAVDARVRLERIRRQTLHARHPDAGRMPPGARRR